MSCEQQWTLVRKPFGVSNLVHGPVLNAGESIKVVPASRLAEVERERDDADSLIRELATILGPGKAPKSVGRVEFWIGRVGQALGEREAALERAREALEEIAALDPERPFSPRDVIDLARAALDAIGPAT